MGRQIMMCLISYAVQTLCYQVVLLELLLIACSLQVPVSASNAVEFLPGFSERLPFSLETGYIEVGESEEIQLFYYFVKSERNPEKDPLLIWLTGGPGCSGWSAFVHEVGPLRFKVEPYNGSLPTFVLNQYSWTKISSIVFVDSPVGTGFSYEKTSSATITGDLKQVQDLVQFLKKWLIDHPEFISNPIYIAGESYSGITVPVLVQQISNGIEEGVLPPINLQGYILGNALTYPSDYNYRIPFAHGMALISDELYNSLERSCGGEYYKNIDPSNTKCLKEFQAFEKEFGHTTFWIQNALLLPRNQNKIKLAKEDLSIRILKSFFCVRNRHFPGLVAQTMRNCCLVIGSMILMSAEHFIYVREV